MRMPGSKPGTGSAVPLHPHARCLGDRASAARSAPTARQRQRFAHGPWEGDRFPTGPQPTLAFRSRWRPRLWLQQPARTLHAPKPRAGQGAMPRACSRRNENRACRKRKQPALKVGPDVFWRMLRTRDGLPSPQCRLSFWPACPICSLRCRSSGSRSCRLVAPGPASRLCAPRGPRPPACRPHPAFSGSHPQ